MLLRFSVSGFSRWLRAAGAVVFVGPALALAGCSGEPAATEAAAPRAGAARPKPAAAAQPAPLRVRVVVPYAGSMPGFMNYRAPIGATNTEFQRRVGGLLTAIGKGPTTLAARGFFTTDATGALTKSTYAELRALVDGTAPRARYAPGVEIPALLADATAAAEATGAVTILVTDLTHNGGLKTTLAALPGAVTAALTGNQGPVAFSVYAEPSRFAGLYYPALRSGPKEVKGGPLPYYIWLIGPAAQISRVARQFLPNAPEKQVHVGLTYPALAGAALLTGLPAGGKLVSGGAGTVYADAGGVAVEDARKGVEFSFGLDLRDLPMAWQEPAFLAKALEASLPNGAAALVAGSVRRLTAAERSTSTTLQPYSHVVRVRITKLAPKTSTFTLALPAPALPAWPTQWSTDTDKPPSLTTYRLQQILEGARQAHGEAALPPVFSVALPLTNQD
ncbi:MAG: hypothetical protein H7330_05110 [Hymenobacteraceae bacterium]|nr:hypothetical protein [Hymenobacteraceae bacterium]